MVTSFGVGGPCHATPFYPHILKSFRTGVGIEASVLQALNARFLFFFFLVFVLTFVLLFGNAPRHADWLSRFPQAPPYSFSLTIVSLLRSLLI